MEAKQSAKRIKAKQADPLQPELIPEDATQVKAGAATRGTVRWDKVMRAAKRQAEDYARALPKEHGWPPFILVVDVGHVIEIYADFSGQGKNYAQFPDRDGYSIPLEGLRDRAIRERLRAIWSAPHTLDPAKRQCRGHPRHRRAPRSHRPQSGGQARPQGGRGVPHALSLHHVRRGCRPPAQEGVRDAVGPDGRDARAFRPGGGEPVASDGRRRLRPASERDGQALQRHAVQEAQGDRAGEGRYPRASHRCRARLARRRARHLRHAAGARARQAGALEARRPLHAARLCRAAGRAHDYRAATRRLGRGADPRPRAGGGGQARSGAKDRSRISTIGSAPPACWTPPAAPATSSTSRWS